MGFRAGLASGEFHGKGHPRKVKSAGPSCILSFFRQLGGHSHGTGKPDVLCTSPFAVDADCQCFHNQLQRSRTGTSRKPPGKLAEWAIFQLRAPGKSGKYAPGRRHRARLLILALLLRSVTSAEAGPCIYESGMFW